MVPTTKTVYRIYSPKRFSDKEKAFNHNIFQTNDERHIVPIKFSDKSLNPESFVGLKTMYDLGSIFIIDRLKNTDTEVCIIDHVNRSGTNFLVGKTPHKELSTFPDMGHIYNPIPNMKQVLVHTVGPGRFLNDTDTDEIVSEATGLIAPLWHYVGVSVFARNY
tara:strand:+ start:589 stop:1077 length:489 start_codon:yes stop_codon:yes gene_type:complete